MIKYFFLFCENFLILFLNRKRVDNMNLLILLKENLYELLFKEKGLNNKYFFK